MTDEEKDREFSEKMEKLREKYKVKWTKETEDARKTPEREPYKSQFVFTFVKDKNNNWRQEHSWTQTKKQYLPKEKYQMVIQNVGEVIEEIKTKKWYQVYTFKDGKPWVFGFAIKDGIVEHFPIHQVNGRPAEEARQWLRHQKPVEVVKICEQVLNP